MGRARLIKFLLVWTFFFFLINKPFRSFLINCRLLWIMAYDTEFRSSCMQILYDVHVFAVKIYYYGYNMVVKPSIYNVYNNNNMLVCYRYFYDAIRFMIYCKFQLHNSSYLYTYYIILYIRVLNYYWLC